MKAEDITVHIMERNEEFWIGYILQSLTQFMPNILVFDTGSNDNTIPIVKSFPSVTLIQQGELDREGLGRCRNEMMELTITPWVWQVDGDEYYPPASIEALLRYNMPEGKELGFTLFWDVGWNGSHFTSYLKRKGQHIFLSKFNRVALLRQEARYIDRYPFEYPTIFKDAPELHEYLPDEIVGFHLHPLARSSKDEEVLLRPRKRGWFSMMPADTRLGGPLDIEFGDGSWPNPYLDYLKEKQCKG